MSIRSDALSHVKSYMYEYLYYTLNRSIDEAVEIAYSCKTLKDFENLKKSNTRYNRCDPVAFYRAMVVTIKYAWPYGDDFKEHSGTECRGWHRVWSYLNDGDMYFSDMDLGRDVAMAESFHKAGAITDEQFEAYKTFITLSMARTKRFQKENGQPDPNLILAYWVPEYVDVIMDMRIIDALRV